MALSRRNSARFQPAIWPGFVDAMTGLLLVLTFVLALFIVVQFVLQQLISGQEDALGELTSEVAALADALGLEEARAEGLEQNIASLTSLLADSRAEVGAQASLIASLNAQSDAQSAALEDAASQISQFEAEVAALMAAQLQRDAALEELEGEARALEVDRDLFRERLAGAQDELTSMTLALEAQRKKAEETLTLLAGAQASEENLTARLAAALAAREVSETELAQTREATQNLQDQLAAALAAQIASQEGAAEALSEAEQRAILLEQANRELAELNEQSADDRRSIALLNSQVAALRTQIAQLGDLLAASEEASQESDAQITNLGARLNSALAQLAQEERRLRQFEEAERRRLEAEAQSLERYRSVFLSQVRDLLEGQDGIQIVGDRFVFASEVLFPVGEATISDDGKAQIATVAKTISDISAQIPPEINWVLQVDGHTDDTPISGTGELRDNWELSLARALSVVRYLSEDLGIPPSRLSANGFGEFQPVDPSQTPEARLKNRRIELKLTER